MHKQKIIILIAVLAGIISIFLPWFSMPMAGVTEGTQVDYSWLGALIYATIFYTLFAGYQSRPFTSRQKWLTAFKGIAVSCYGFLKYSEFKADTVSYTHLRAHETVLDLVCRLLLETTQ